MYRVKNDNYNVYIVKVTTNKKGDELEKVIGGYYSTFENALLGFAKENFMSSDLSDIENILKAGARVEKELKEIILSYKGGL